MARHGRQSRPLAPDHHVAVRRPPASSLSLTTFDEDDNVRALRAGRERFLGQAMG
ncbi:hypothetical protein QA942_38635 [Streptomyces sp. B21-106]|uniref:hypothetical protein n=1 Tax=Streptomyces sp. B21-106 TaxID=3039418 RepID=UPI002FEFF69E